MRPTGLIKRITNKLFFWRTSSPDNQTHEITDCWPDLDPDASASADTGTEA